MKLQNLICTAISGGTLLSSGCISHDETIVKDVERVPVSFENDTAGRLFYKTLSRTNVRRGRQEDSTKVQIPIVFEHKVRTVTGEGAAFNEAVGRCDTNRDGKITETEAKIFADQYDKKRREEGAGHRAWTSAMPFGHRASDWLPTRSPSGRA